MILSFKQGIMSKKLKLKKYFMSYKIYVNLCNLGRFLVTFEFLCSLKKVVKMVQLYIKTPHWQVSYITVFIPICILVLSESLFMTLLYEYYGLYPEFFFFGMQRYEEILIPMSLLEPPISEEALLAQQQESLQAIMDKVEPVNLGMYTMSIGFGLIALTTVIFILSGRV